MTDNEAISRLKNGDIGGLGILVTRYQVKALRSAFLILHDEQLAEDVVQETFLRVYHKIGVFDTNRPFEPYLMRSVVNACLTAYKQDASKRTISQSDLRGFEELIAHAADVESQVEFSLLKEEILTSLRKLTPRQRAVIVQRYYLGMSEKEMVQSLNIAPGTVRWLLDEARKRLRNLLNGKRGVK